MSELLSERIILISASSKRSITIKLQSLLFAFLLVTIFTSAFLPNVSGVSAASVPVVFSVSNSSDRFQHLAVDKGSGLVYIGGVNRLYQLSPNLESQVTVETGPRNKSLDCPDDVQCPNSDNVNKVLIIDYDSHRLIACGTLNQGICSLRELKDINKELIEGSEPVVANNSKDSTVAFIGPGPSKAMTNVLYVGVTHASNSSKISAVSSRSLDAGKTFQFAGNGATKISVSVSYRAQYPIHYVYGFSSEGFSYFLTNQREDVAGDSKFISKLVRVCQKDSHYDSYTEVPLECVSQNDTSYNLVQAAYVDKPVAALAAELEIQTKDDVLYAVFAQSEDGSNRPTSRSALCVYSLKFIRKRFMENIENCFKGEGKRGLDYITPNIDCRKKGLTITEDYCGSEALNSPLGGNLPVSRRPVYTTDTVLLTAVASASTENFTVFYLGTSNGHLKKVLLENAKDTIERLRASEYDEIIVDKGNRVSSDLSFDPLRSYLYVMTERKVTKVPRYNCDDHKTCEECLQAKDPHCGWCSLQSKCGLRTDCQIRKKDPFYWITYKNPKCAAILSVTPNQIQRSTTRMLSLVLGNLLKYIDSEFQCVFSAAGKTLVTNAIRTTGGVNCMTPSVDQLPSNPHGQYQMIAELSVRTSAGTDFVATNFTFYDCAAHDSCTECILSSYPCSWCVNGNQCTHDKTESCRNDTVIAGFNVMGSSVNSELEFCPQISSVPGTATEMLVSHGIKKDIKVKLENITPFMTNASFVCQFNIEEKVTTVPAQLQIQRNINITDGHIVACDDMEFTYSSRAPNITATFAVTWDGSKLLENPQNFHVLIYRCSQMVNNCGLCLTMDVKFLCGWCQTSETCELREHCSSNGTDDSWLDRNQICPKPQVTRFYPRLGPLEGGTNVTIEGVNLGLRFADIGEIIVAGILCRPYEELYVQTKRIVCAVEGVKPIESRRGPVVVRVSNLKTNESVDLYEFVDPIIESIHPASGPLSGGTQLTIRGRFLNAGSSIQAFIEPALPCQITNMTGSHVTCRTSASTQLRKGGIRMQFDRGERRFTQQMYEYVADPTIENTYTIKEPKGIPSGGIIISVRGNNFQYIQEPKIVVYRNGNHSGNCQVLKPREMKCRSPSIPVDDQLISPDEPLILDYGFLMDGVSSLLNLSLLPNPPKFRLYPDPVFTKFNPEVKYYNSESNDAKYLTIKGNNLKLAIGEDDVNVTIGTAACELTSLLADKLICLLPATQQPATGSKRNDVHDVVVFVGEKSYVVGKLSYGSETNIPVIIGATVGSGVFVAILLGLVFFYFRKLKKKSQALKTMEVQMKRLDEGRHDVFPQARGLLEGNLKGINPLLPLEDQTECLPYDVRWEFPSHRLKLGKELGTGYFGRVVKAEAVGIKNAEEFVKTVAVKMVRSQTNIGALQALASELKIMIHLGSHLNVLNLLGACTINITKGELLVIVEYCRFGCLRSYLVKNRKSFVNQMGDDSENTKTDKKLIPFHLKLEENTFESGSNNTMESFLLTDTNSTAASSKCSELHLADDIKDDILDPEPLWQYKQNDDEAPVSFSTQDLISWSFQIARGMNYLASKKVFHGDLAARNVLLADNGVVKVADFGMARKMYYEEDYKKSGQGPMPIRWMAIESMTDKIFSSQSDVWSFGVLLWELFSLGKVPYPGMNNKSFVEELENGYRLQKPEYAPNSFKDIMSSCWQKNPKNRPTFSELEETISREMEEYVGTYYCNLNETYEDSNQKKETASSTDLFGLAKFLITASKLEKSTSVISLSDKGNRKLAAFSRIFHKNEKRATFHEAKLRVTCDAQELDNK